MRKIGLIRAAALLFAVVGLATAASARSSEFRPSYNGRHVNHHLRAQDYDHFDYGIRRPTYHSGWGGPYGDGDYPGTIGQNMGPSYW